MTTFSYSKLIVVNKLLEEKGMKLDFRLWGEGSPITFGEMKYYYEAYSFEMLKQYGRLLKSGEAFMKLYPTSLYFSAIKMCMDRAINELQVRETGRAKIDNKLQMVEFEAYVGEFDYLTSFVRHEYMGDSIYRIYKDILNLGNSKEIFNKVVTLCQQLGSPAPQLLTNKNS